ncbi:MAG: hypothetical protein KA731_02485 [Candidatus Moranbacteria bacterium]|nr:hypothetical protein [Candidatus Moranbacteria bacterium]MBP6034187.1 hypothetical protein [Candidatus Moranbacteria bacterium]
MNTESRPRAIVTRDDPLILIRLLSSLVDLADRDHEKAIIFADIIRLAHECGYADPLSWICRELVVQGFLSKHANGIYSISETNRQAIRQFQMEFDPLYANTHLSDAEQRALLSDIASGSDTGRAVLRITRLFAALQQEFSSLGTLKRRNQEAIAQHAAAHILDSDRAQWMMERQDLCLERAFKLRPAASFGGLGAFALAISDAKEAHDTLLELTEKLEQEYSALTALAQDEEMIKAMELISNIFDRLIQAFIKAEVL